MTKVKNVGGRPTKHEARYKNNGRPTSMTPETIKKIEEAFAVGCSDLEACLMADITTATLYNYQKKNPAFLERKAMLKETLPMKARLIVDGKINEGDFDAAKWLLERKKKAEFSTRVESTGEDGKAQRHIVEFDKEKAKQAMKEIEEELKNE